MTDTAPTQRATFGWLGFAIGGAALILTIVILWAGPFAPQQAAGISLGELAADIAKSAARSVMGEPQPAMVSPQRNIDDYLEIFAGVLAGLAVLSGVAGYVRHEQKRVAISGIALGGAAMGIQIFAWSIMLLAGALIVMSVMASLREVFGNIFGGLLGD